MANQALYQAKRGGRNQVVIWQENSQLKSISKLLNNQFIGWSWEDEIG